MLIVQFFYHTVHVDRPLTAGWLTTNFLPRPMRLEQHLRSSVLPYLPSTVYQPAYPVYLIQWQKHTLWRICLTWLSARENSHVPSSSKKPRIVVVEAMMMTCQRKASTAQHSSYSHNSAQTVALSLCTSCTHMCHHWFTSIRDNWYNISGGLNTWINEWPGRTVIFNRAASLGLILNSFFASQILAATLSLFPFPSSERG